MTTEICYLGHEAGGEIAARQFMTRLAEPIIRPISDDDLKDIITRRAPASQEKVVLLKYFEDHFYIETLKMIDKHNLNIITAERVAKSASVIKGADYFAVSVKPMKQNLSPVAREKNAMVLIRNVENSRYASKIIRTMSEIELPYSRLFFQPQELYFELSASCKLLYSKKLLHHFFPKLKILGFYEAPE